MSRSKSTCVLFIIIFMIFYGDITGNGKNNDRKTIERNIDYVIVRGKILKNNLNNDIGRMSLLSSINGIIKPIPFQIDEISPEGEYILTQVPPGDFTGEGPKPEKDADNGFLDDNDQLVFMIRDSGDRINDRGQLPGDVAAFDEIQLFDPIASGMAWVYLCTFKSSPGPPGIDYIKYQLPQNLLASKNYVLGFPKEAPVFPGYLTLSGSENILDRMKLRVNTRIFFIPYTVNEENLASSLSLYKDGPVRVIRRSSTNVRFMGIFRTPYLAVEMIAYDKIAMIPIRLNVPLNLKDYKSVLKVVMRAGVDFHNVKGWKMKTNIHKNWITLDGKMNGEKKGMNGEDLNWFLLNGDGKTFVVRIILNRNHDGSFQDTPITPHLYFIDDDKSEDKPENVPGQSPCIMYQLDGFENLSKGYLYIYAIFYIIDNYEEGMEAKYLKIMDSPIEAVVKP